MKPRFAVATRSTRVRACSIRLALAKAIAVPGNRVHAIVNGARDVTADTDLRLSRFFGLSEGYFLRLQNAYDTLEAKRRIADQLAKIEPYKPRRAA